MYLDGLGNWQTYLYGVPLDCVIVLVVCTWTERDTHVFDRNTE